MFNRNHNARITTRWIVAILMAFIWLTQTGFGLVDGGIPIAQTDSPQNAETESPSADTAGSTAKQSATQSQINDLLLWFMIALGGMVGGLLFGMRDKKLVLPHQDNRSKHTYNPGFVVDILFGLVGGFVIFMVVPGDFDISQGGFVVVKILALAAIGGYGGRALIETVLQKQLQELKNQIQELQDQPSTDAKTLSLLNQQLDHDPSTAVDKDELKKLLMEASSSVLVVAFDQARSFRQQALSDDKPERLEQVIPIFEALIAIDQRDNEPEKYHRNYGQFGYALKDKDNPDNLEAIKAFTKAIEIRDRGDDKNSYRLYELNRATCKIRVKASFEEIKADLDAALGWPKTASMVQQRNEKYGSDLTAWLTDPENQAKLTNWITVNHIELPVDSPEERSMEGPGLIEDAGGPG